MKYFPFPGYEPAYPVYIHWFKWGNLDHLYIFTTGNRTSMEVIIQHKSLVQLMAHKTMESHSRQVTYNYNKIQKPSRSTFWKRMGHFNGILICDGLVGCCASPVKEKISKWITGCSMLCWFLYARNHHACTEYTYLSHIL